MKAVTQEEVFGSSSLIKTINDRVAPFASLVFFFFFASHADTKGAISKLTDGAATSPSAESSPADRTSSGY